MSAEHKTSVLLVDGSEADYVIIRDMLSEKFSKEYNLEWAETFEEGVERLFKGSYDACLVNYDLGEHNGVDFIKRVICFQRHFPLILFTHEENRDIDIKAQSAGASEFFVLGQLTPPFLDRSIRYSIERATSERHLLELAHKDSLTGLANRTMFQIRLEDALAQSKRTGYSVAVIAIDLNNFKEVNDHAGHVMGDSLLVEVSNLLKSATRETDTLARLSGDKFSVVVTNLKSEADAEIVAGRFLSRLAKPILIDEAKFEVTASVGIAMSPPDGLSAQQMIKNCDEALYQAKTLRNAPYHFFNPEIHRQRLASRKFEKELLKSIRKDELFVVYQPIVDLRMKKIVGAEALVRWNHPEQGFIRPDQFIGIAEKNGFINELGPWVLKMACETCADWVKKGHTTFSMAVNVSLAQLKNYDLVELVTDVILETGLNYKNLTIEITESMIADDARLVQETLSLFQKLGIRISVDDFGTGHSSLSRLKNFPINYLKVDQSLLTHIGSDQQDSAIAVAILTLAKELNLDVVGEGIETKGQVDFLIEKGCSHAQGYYFGKPVLASEFEEKFLGSLTPEGFDLGDLESKSA